MRGLAEALSAGAPEEDAFARYERRRNEATLPDYHENLHLARLGPFPPEVLDRRAAIRGDEEKTRGFYLASEGLALGSHRLDYLLDPAVVYLNHGSYGACPAPVFARYQELQRELERNPSEFLGRRFDDLLAESRAALGGFVGARPEDLVFVPNATAGLNAVIRSLQLGPDDEVLTTRHEYGAVNRTWEFMGATLVYAEPGEVAAAIGPRTKAVSVSHITSPTALVLPVEEICAAAREAGVLSIVDGAHAPGHLPLDLERLGADIYAGNCHKWLCAPKGAGFLWARPEHQTWIEPLVISWGYGGDASFAERHGWQGTRDPAPALSVPAAIDAHRGFDLERCRQLAASFHDRLPPVPGTPAPQMWATEVTADDPAALQRRLFDEHRIEVVVSAWEGMSLLRVSIAPYNEAADVERLISALADCVAAPGHD